MLLIFYCYNTLIYGKNFQFLCTETLSIRNDLCKIITQRLVVL